MSSYLGSEFGGQDRGGYLFKVIVVGDQGVGKSSILLQYTKKQFKQEYNVTIGVEFASKCIEIQNGKDKLPLTVQIWDTAGQETFKSLIRSFYQKSAAAFMVYNVTKRSSFNNLNEWLQEIRNNAHEDIVIVVVGNQVDQENKREVEYEEGVQYVKDNNLDFFYETSAKTSYNIEESFKQVAELVYDKFIKNKTSFLHSMRGESEDFSNMDYMNSPDKHTLGGLGAAGNEELIKNLQRSQSQPRLEDLKAEQRTKSYQLSPEQKTNNLVQQQQQQSNGEQISLTDKKDKNDKKKKKKGGCC